MKGSIGEGPNNSNYSDQSSVEFCQNFNLFRYRIFQLRCAYARGERDASWTVSHAAAKRSLEEWHTASEAWTDSGDEDACVVRLEPGSPLPPVSVAALPFMCILIGCVAPTAPEGYTSVAGEPPLDGSGAPVVVQNASKRGARRPPPRPWTGDKYHHRGLFKGADF